MLKISVKIQIKSNFYIKQKNTCQILFVAFVASNQEISRNKSNANQNSSEINNNSAY